MRAAAGCSPARRARSTAASVWPLRRNTPASWAYSGFIWPGRPNVSGTDSGSASARMVAQRSSMLTPVEQPSSLSTVTVNGVPNIEVFCSTWWGSSSSLQRDMVRGTHSTPRAFLSIKFTCSGVIFSAATMRSPSFSRSSSSTTITILPWRKSSIASSMLSRCILSFIVCNIFYPGAAAFEQVLRGFDNNRQIAPRGLEWVLV